MKTLLGSLFFVSLLCSAADGMVVFNDDFETQGLFAEKWKVSKNVLPMDGAVTLKPGQMLSPKIDLHGKSFAVEADLTFLGGEKGGHAGIVIDGIHFMIRNGSSGWNTAYLPSGMKRSKGTGGPISDFVFGQTVRWRVSREKMDQSSKYTLSVNGKVMTSFIDTLKEKPTASFYAYRSEMKIDNVRVLSLIQGEVSPNTVVNSSFEHLLDGMPPYYNLQTSRYILWKNFEKSFDTCKVTTECAHSGKQSLRLAVTPEVPRNGFATTPVGCMVGKPVTGSVWLRANKPVKAQISMHEQYHKFHNKDIMLSTEWTRYSLTVENPSRSAISLGMGCKEQGTIIWADDVQIEGGSEATPWKASSLDAEKFVSQEKVVSYTPAQYTIPVAAKGTVPPASLDDLLNLKPLKIDEFFWHGKKYSGPNLTTACFLAMDDVLYIGIRAKTDDLKKVNKTTGGRDAGSNFRADCVEIFIDGNLSNKKYIQLCINSSGSVTDLGCGRNLKWDGKWTASVTENQKESSMDYLISIPYSDLADVGLSEIWGINIGRSCAASKQCLNMIPVREDNYHKVDMYSRFKLPEKQISAIRKSAVPAVQNKGDAVDVFFTRSFYMKEENALLAGIVNIPNVEKMTAELKIANKTFKFDKLTPSFEFTVPVKDFPLGDHAGTFSLTEGGKTVIQTPVKLRKLEYNEQNTPIDHRVRALVVNGKPRVIVAPFGERNANFDDMRDMVDVLKKVGFEFWMPGFHVPDENATYLANLCDKEGIHLIVWFFSAWKNRNGQNWEEFFASMPQKSIIGFLMVDEPELYAKSDEVRDYMRTLRKVMQRVPVMMNNTVLGIPSKFADFETDVFGIDDYLTNSESRTVLQMYEDAISIEDSCRKERKPGFFFMSGGNLHNHYREPTRQEQIAQSYCSIVAGLTVISYFIGKPSWPGDWEGMKQFNREIVELNDIILSPEKAERVTCSNPRVKFTVRKYQGKLYIIAVNPMTSQEKVSFNLPEQTGTASIRFEKRSLAVKNGVLNDTFQPLERHVYEIGK